MPRKVKNVKIVLQNVKKSKPRKSKSKNQTKPRNTRKRQSLPKNSPFRMPMCTAKYALALANPFSGDAIGACVPSGNNRSSQKAHGFNKFVVTLNSKGFGCVVFIPSLANDAPAAFYTTASSTVDSSTYIDLADGNWGYQNLYNLPYATTGLKNSSTEGHPPPVVGRVVSMGYRARYIGTELNRSGLVYVYTSSTHSTLEGLTVAQIASYVDCTICTPDVDHTAVAGSIYGINDLELEYPVQVSPAVTSLYPEVAALRLVYPYSGGAYSTASYVNNGYGLVLKTGIPLGLIAFSGVAGQQYYVEMTEYVEYIGDNTQSMQTKNSTDIDGAARVREAVSTAQIERPNSRLGDLFTAFKNAFIEGVEEHAPAALNKGAAMLGNKASQSLMRTIF